jgi:hypothetical protein
MAHQTIFLQGDEVISTLDEKRIFGKALNLNNSYLYAVQLKDGTEDLPKIKKNISCKRNCFCSKFNFDT